MGGDLNSPRNGATGLNNQETIDSFMVKVYRYAETELMQWDFKVSKGDFYPVPAGHVGLAAG